VAIYSRISEDPDETMVKTARQIADCKRWTKDRGWEVVGVFEDDDVSAFKRNAKRPAFAKMIQAVKAGEVDAVVAWHIDRLSRHRSPYTELMDACEDAGAFIATVTDGVDTRTSAGEFIADILVSHARMASQDASRRIKRKHLEMAEQGLPAPGGRRTFGYEPGLMRVNRTEAKHIRDAARRIFAGETLHGIAKDWQERGITTTEGNPWKPGNLSRLLCSLRISAQREHLGVVTPGKWPAILTPDDSTRLRAILRAPGRQRFTPTGRTYMLTGIIRCGLCGEPMVGRPSSTHYRRYICNRQPGTRGCGKVTRLADPVEELVVFRFLERLAHTDLTLPENELDVAGIAQDIRADERALDELSHDYYAEKAITRREFFNTRKSIEERLHRRRRQLAETDKPRALAPLIGRRDVAAVWEGMTFAAKRVALGAVIDQVVIYPAVKGWTRFDPTKVEVRWRI